MRGSLVIAAASAAVLAAAAPAAAATPQLGCKDANGPLWTPHAIGPLAAIGGADGFADPAVLERFRRDDGDYWAKTPPRVRRGRTVTISIARRDRGIAEIDIGGTHADAFRFTACPRRRWTAWAGGFRLKHPACLRLTARERGKRRIHRAVVSFGMRDACDNGTSSSAAAARPRTLRAGCRDANGPTGVTRHPIGPLAAIGGVEYWADPAAMERSRQDFGVYWSKAPPTVRRGRTVTISIARRDRGFAEMLVGGRHSDSFRFTACPRRPWSAWAGGFQLKHPACLRLTARERGKRRVDRTIVSFGMGDSCS